MENNSIILFVLQLHKNSKKKCLNFALKAL